MSTTPTEPEAAAVFDPGRFALESLVAAGAHEAAAKLAIRLVNATTAADGGTAAVDKPTTLSHAELKALSRDDVLALLETKAGSQMITDSLIASAKAAGKKWAA